MKAKAFIARPGYQAALGAILLMGVFLVFMALVQFTTPDLADNDGYYHIKLAYLMRTEGLKPDFPYLPLTVLNPREFSDHHFLYHVFLIPFTFGDLRLGAKWASILFASLAFLSVWWLFQRQKIPFAGLWALGLLAVSEAFIYRMSIPRAQSLSLAFLALGLLALLERRYGLIAPLAFFYVWFYNAFPLIFGLVGAYVLAVLLLERRFEWRPLVYAGLGVGLGVLINPYFPQNLIFLARHLLPKLTETTAVSVGSEWYPYDTGQLLSNSPGALLVFCAGILALGLNNRRMDVRTAASLFLALLFGLMLFQSRRFIEYFPAFALIFAAFAWTPIILTWQSFENLTLNQMNQGLLNRPALREILPGFILVLLLLSGMGLSLRAAQDSLQTSKPYTQFAGASAWLAANTADGEMIFQTDWDDFPRLFYYNTHNRYLIGLDPTYMQLYDPELYTEWVNLTRGRVANPGQEIRDRFAARFVVSDLLHKDFIRQAQQDPTMREVYRDESSVIFQIQ